MPGEFSQAMRALIRARDEDRCVVCGRPQMGGGHLHHRQLRSQQGQHTADNGILTCDLCHHWIHHNVRASRESGFIVPSWSFPCDVPIKSWRGLIRLGMDGAWDPAEL